MPNLDDRGNGRPLSALIVLNPTSGSGRAARLGRRLGAALEARGVHASVAETKGKGEAADIAACWASSAEDPGASPVVCIGGDGTLNETASGLAGTGVPLAVLPAGTANMLAREIGAPSDPEEAAAAVAAGGTVLIDAGTWKDRIFLCCAGVGFDAEVARLYGLGRKGAAGWAAYAAPMALALRMARAQLEAGIDGEIALRRGFWALASNIRNYGGLFSLTPAADPSDGLLDFVMACEGPAMALPRSLVLALAGRFGEVRPRVEARARAVSVRPIEGRVPVQLDGDFAGWCSPDDPAEFGVRPSCVRLSAPGAAGAD